MHKPFLLALAFSLLLTGANAQVKSLPEFTFKRMADGADYSRKDVPAGKKTLFLFFDTECPHCMRATSQYNQHTKEMAGTTVLMVTMDAKEKVMTFLNTYGSNLYGKKNLILLADPNRQFISRFLPKKYPAMYLFNAKGELLLYSDEEKDVPQFIQKIK